MTKLFVIFFASAILINAAIAVEDGENAENGQRMVQQHNEAYNNGKTSFRMKFIPAARKVFLFSLKKLVGLKDRITNFVLEAMSMRGVKRFKVRRGKETAPEYVDLRDRGVVTSVKNQGECGSCWAFAITGALEAYYKNKTGELVELSQQYLVDCSTYPWSLKSPEDKCGGNFPPRGLRLAKANGMVRAADYPYIDAGGECDKTKRPTELHKINEIMSIKNDEIAMKEALHLYGPLIASVGITEPLAYYRAGVYAEPIPGYHPRHAVLIVGYGTHPQHGPYWIIKNSWGEEWGEAGYMRLTRDPARDGGLSTIAFFVR